MSTFILILTVTFATLVLGLFVYGNNRKNKTNLFFCIFCLLSSLWIVVNYFSVSNTENIELTKFLIQSVLFITTWLVSSLLLLSLSYPNNNKYMKRSIEIKYLITTIFISILAYFPTTVSSVKIIENNITPSFGLTFFIYVLFLLFNIGLSLYVLIKKYFNSKGLDRLRIQYLFVGFLGMIAISLVSNLVFVVILHNSSFVVYGPLSVIILDLFIAFAIIKHRFLSITNFANNIIAILANTILLHILFYGLAYIYITIFGTIFTTPVYIIGFFVGIGSAYIINIFFRKSNNAKFINKTYDPQIYLNILREKDFINLSIKETLSQFIDITKQNMGVLTIDVLNYELDKKSLKKYFHDKPILHKLYLTQEDAELFSNTEDKEEISAFICIFKNKLPNIVLMLHHRINYSAYDIEDIRALKEASERINLVISRNFLTDEQKNFNEILQDKLNTATEELLKQKAEVEDRYRTERDMVGIMGHELRTPLTSARGFLEIIMTKAKNNPDTPVKTYQHYLDNVYDAFKREIDLVQTMLSTSHVDNNKLNLTLVEVDLEGIIKGALMDFSPEAEKKKLGLEYHHIENIPHIKMDPSRTIEVINNLISNAIKYTDMGKVDIYVTYDDQYVYYAVKDTGKGIPENEIPNIGKKFYRVENYLSEDKQAGTNILRPGGTGLGMYIVKAILTAAGGELRIESKVGEGSTFTAVFQKF